MQPLPRKVAFIWPEVGKNQDLLAMVLRAQVDNIDDFPMTLAAGCEAP